MAVDPISFFQGYMWFSIVYAIVILGYSIYVIFLNYRQAQVKGLIEETNKILLRIEKKLER